MTREMIDCIHENLPQVLPVIDGAGITMVAAYVTGTQTIRWTDADLGKLHAATRVVTIDQGAAGSPVGHACVRDVEPGAWTIAAAVNRAGWTAPRPTIYISASRLGELVTAGWDGDVWVADWVNFVPTAPPVLPAGAKFKIVAWQFRNFGAYDSSIVFDPDWPGSAPSAPTPAPTTTDPAAIVRQLPTISAQTGGDVADVRTVQALCCARGSVIAIDGVFGPLTTAAVRYEQNLHGLTIDGIVGPQTWPMLMGVQ